MRGQWKAKHSSIFSFPCSNRDDIPLSFSRKKSCKEIMTIISHFFLSFLSFSLLVLPFLFHFLVDLSFLFICDDSKLPEFILLELLPFPRFVPGEKLASYSFLSSVMQATVSGSVFLPRIPARCGTHFACRGSFGLPLCNRVHNICLLHSPNLFFFLLLPLRFFSSSLVWILLATSSVNKQKGSTFLWKSAGFSSLWTFTGFHSHRDYVAS